MSLAAQRKSTRQSGTATATVTSARAPRRCRVCPNNPLKATCRCSERRRAVQNPQTIEDVREPVTQPPASVPQVALAGLHASTHIPAVSFSSTTFCEGITHCQAQVNHQEYAQLHNGSINNYTPAPADHISIPTPIEAHEIAIDPALLVDEPSRAPILDSIPDMADIVEEENQDDEGAGDELEGVGGKSGKRLTVAQKATLYGLVDGVMRGNTEYKVVRQNAKRRPMLDASSATTRYNREIPLVIARAERLAIETDAYVLILAQQATGSSASIHFASERLRREGFDQCADLVNCFQSLMTQLVIAKRSTAMTLTQNLEASERARAQVEERLAASKNVVVTTEAELVATRRANQALLSELEALKSSLASQSQLND